MAIISLAVIQSFGTVSLEDIPLSEDQGTWFVSIDILMAITFTPVGGKVTEVFGIKKTFLACTPIIILGWILVGIFTTSAGLLLGRVLCGVGVAILMASPSVYIAETVHPDQRAMLSSIVGLSFNSGVCILWFLGYFFDWQTVAFLSTCPAILAFIGFLILPDTPYWLIQKNREEEAFEALKYFRKNDPEKEVIDEFNEMLQHLRSKTRMSHFEKLQSICSLSFIKPFLCIGILYPLHELCKWLYCHHQLFPIYHD